MSSHCNINLDYDSDHFTEYKERQVFIALLLLQRISNFQSIPHLMRLCIYLLIANHYIIFVSILYRGAKQREC